MSEIIIKENNVETIKEAFKGAILQALENIGGACEEYAKINAPVDTSWLSQRITHIVDAGEMAVYIGTNVEYAPYVELGTGIYATEGGGRQDAWAYQDIHGNWHRTHGQRPQPFLKPAAEEHLDEYRAIMKETLENG